MVHHGPSGKSYVVGTRQEIEQELATPGGVLWNRPVAVFPTAPELIAAAELLEAGSRLTPDGDLIGLWLLR